MSHSRSGVMPLPHSQCTMSPPPAPSQCTNTSPLTSSAQRRHHSECCISRHRWRERGSSTRSGSSLRRSAPPTTMTWHWDSPAALFSSPWGWERRLYDIFFLLRTGLSLQFHFECLCCTWMIFGFGLFHMFHKKNIFFWCIRHLRPGNFSDLCSYVTQPSK